MQNPPPVVPSPGTQWSTFEPNFIFGLGAPTFLPEIDFDNLGFSFHNYDDSTGFEQPVRKAFDYAGSASLPLLVTEFGGTTNIDSIIEAEAVHDKAMLSAEQR